MTEVPGDAMIDIALKGRVGDFDLDAAFATPALGITAIFGPSGSGKTTLLRAIAGLSHLTGHVRVAGETWQDARTFVPVHHRRVGYVFQEPSLLPHLSVQGNLDYGWYRQGAARPEGGQEGDKAGDKARDQVIETLRLGALLTRRPDGLSGGERQRAAMARAVLSAPKLLLMDEPLSSLDGAARAEILPMIARIAETVPILYVSHDAVEIEKLGARVLSMKDGRVSAAPEASVEGLSDAQIRALAKAALRAGLRA